MHKKQNYWAKQAATLCAEISPEDGIDPRFLNKEHSRNKISSKKLQLCKEAERVLSLVLAGEMHNPLLQDLDVLSVFPEGQGQQLCVSIAYDNNDSAVETDQVIAALNGIQGLLRTTLAQSINRKRVPLLRFQLLAKIDKEGC